MPFGSKRQRSGTVTKWEETMKRVAQLIVAAALCLAAPLSAHAQNAGGGLPQFQVDPFWPKHLPNNWILGQVSGITVDRFDRIWVVQRPGSLTKRERAAEQNPPVSKCCAAAPPVLVFDQSGNLVKTWGGPGPGYQWPESEHGIYIDDNDFVWLAGNGKKDGQLLKFTMDGKFVLQVGKSGEGHDSNSTERLGSPADIAVDVPAKEVYAADGYENHRIVVFDSETGAYKRHWGAYGKPPTDEKVVWDPNGPPPQQFGNPVHCITLTNDGLVLVCDRSHNRMQMFRKDGTFVREFSVLKESAPGTIGSIAKWPDAAQTYLIVVDDPNGQFHVINRADGKLVGSFGRVGHQLGEFYNLHNIGIDSKGNIYTAEVQGKRVQKFRNLGGL
jgi:hypothetical protein